MAKMKTYSGVDHKHDVEVETSVSQKLKLTNQLSKDKYKKWLYWKNSHYYTEIKFKADSTLQNSSS